MEKVLSSDATQVRLAFRISYLGERFFGSQMQVDERTVEGEFIAACKRLALFSDHREAVFLAAGRTDRGVHAQGQIFAFTTIHPARAISALNWQLPRDCWCTGYALVDPSFHPRYDAHSRIYRYYYGDQALDTGAMSQAAESFLGTHDFSGFARVLDKNPCRTIFSIRVLKEEGVTVLEVAAGSFLWHQVRYMAAALGEIGAGKADLSMIERRLNGVECGNLQPAPAPGLVLWDIDCGVSFSPMVREIRSVSFLDRVRNHHLVMVRVCNALSGNRVRRGDGEVRDP
jgi:tRNA pseudouridine38-40 synthase